MFRALVVGVIAFVLSGLAGAPVVDFLRARKLGKATNVDGPATHEVKAGTPTMGGILILGTVLIVTLAFNLASRLSILLPFGMIAATGAIGFVDDLGSLHGRRQKALSWRVKVALIALLGLAAGFVLYHFLDVGGVTVPGIGQLHLGIWIVPLAVPIILFTTTAVAITDGLDGLVGGTSAFAFAAYGVIAAMQAQPFLGTFCFTVVGAVLGFLWYNAHPARVFMGETGALPLGAALAIVALMTQQWLLLPVIGVIPFANLAADLLQIGYFKWTHGRRIFRMAPLHNHFEMLGWPETRIVTRFWLIGVAGAMVGVAAALKV
ncbi:MAG: phospho-N-acetylmuramoyl-pentapeptide-transferase [Dehalococcoidia bacterium]